MARSDYYQAKYDVVHAALRVATHNYDQAEDPGWQADLDDEMLDAAVEKMAAAIQSRKDEEESKDDGA